MPNAATSVERSEAILIVVDVQERLAAAMARRAAVLDSARKLMAVAGLVGVPVIVTRQYPAGLGDVEPELRSSAVSNTASSDIAWVDKLAFDCFAEPAFTQALELTRRRQLVIMGMETHICVVQTALSGLAAGFGVHVVGDGCTSRDERSHASALARLRGAGAVVTTTESVLYELVGVAGTDEFRSLLRIVKGQ